MNVDGWAGLESVVTDIRDVDQSVEDLNKLFKNY